MARVYIGIGSNLDRERSIRSAVATLAAAFGPLTVSPVYRSRPVGFEAEDFFNLVVGFDTREKVHRLAGRLREIEQAHGRRRDGHRSRSHTLDLDLLLYGDLIIEEGKLKLPRADITRYGFVLRPLADIAPHEHHPVLAIPFAQLWQTFDQNQEELHPIDLSLESNGIESSPSQ